MKVLISKILTMFAIIASAISLTGCGEDETEMTQKVYYAYYEFSYDLLNLYNININVVDGEFNSLYKINANKDTPYKDNTKTNSKAFFIKCNGSGKDLVIFQTSAKSSKSYDDLEKSDSTYNIMYGYSFHILQDSETEEQAKNALIYSCYRNTLKVTGEKLAAAPKLTESDPVGLTIYEKIIHEIEEATYKLYR